MPEIAWMSSRRLRLRAEGWIVMWPFENDEYPEGYLLSTDQSGPNEPRSDYGRRHGVAVLHYRFGIAFAADRVRLPDGTRGRARSADIGRQHWRRPLNDRERAWSSAAVAIPIDWRWGKLIITPGDVIFEDDQSLPEVYFTDDNERLDRDLYQSREIKDLVVTMEGCNALYRLLVYGFWQRDPDDEPCTYMQDDAARTLATIRGLGERHYDLTNAGWLGYDGGEDHLMRRHLKRLGWHDVREQPIDTLFSESRPNESSETLELMRRMALFLVASVAALHILLAIAALAGG
ncbi:hypothetical protein N182_05165 [Sinorhizobium sp. GL2]|nr:hypothetical protein ASD41_02155 [Ensifer sp. Root1312]KSV70675.1 hypothetical protein N182_05165 [Sinorhizobium sp. GL2]